MKMLLDLAPNEMVRTHLKEWDYPEIEKAASAAFSSCSMNIVASGFAEP
ncbi:hypothetical protein NQ468_001944 [Salmonella enterica]|nr:hypothetical protein [Salmonella enterica subsp. enterica]EJO0601667.1 hypothetical protein [Salmonella enterica]HCZ4969888.1 hypothetical protein [Salmonella enterica subsp. enterica serovar Saintpaul str. CFSAN004160]